MIENIIDFVSNLPPSLQFLCICLFALFGEWALLNKFFVKYLVDPSGLRAEIDTLKKKLDEKDKEFKKYQIEKEEEINELKDKIRDLENLSFELKLLMSQKLKNA